MAEYPLVGLLNYGNPLSYLVDHRLGYWSNSTGEPKGKTRDGSCRSHEPEWARRTYIIRRISLADRSSSCSNQDSNSDPLLGNDYYYLWTHPHRGSLSGLRNCSSAYRANPIPSAPTSSVSRYKSKHVPSGRALPVAALDCHMRCCLSILSLK
jgi:hypothetical protein